MSTSRVSKALLSKPRRPDNRVNPTAVQQFWCRPADEHKNSQLALFRLVFSPQSMDPRMYKSSGFLQVSQSSGNDPDAKAAPPTVLCGSKIFTGIVSSTEVRLILVLRELHNACDAPGRSCFVIAAADTVNYPAASCD